MRLYALNLYLSQSRSLFGSSNISKRPIPRFISYTVTSEHFIKRKTQSFWVIQSVKLPKSQTIVSHCCCCLSTVWIPLKFLNRKVHRATKSSIIGIMRHSVHFELIKVSFSPSMSPRGGRGPAAVRSRFKNKALQLSLSKKFWLLSFSVSN